MDMLSASCCFDRLQWEIMSRLLIRFCPSGTFLASISFHLACLVLFWLNDIQLNKRIELSGRRCWIGISEGYDLLFLKNKHKSRGCVPSVCFSVTLPCPYSFKQHASVCYLCDKLCYWSLRGPPQMVCDSYHISHVMFSCGMTWLEISDVLIVLEAEDVRPFGSFWPG